MEAPVERKPYDGWRVILAVFCVVGWLLVIGGLVRCLIVLTEVPLSFLAVQTGIVLSGLGMIVILLAGVLFMLVEIAEAVREEAAGRQESPVAKAEQPSRQ